MSSHLFVTKRPALLANWSGAFGGDHMLSVSGTFHDGADLTWFDSSTLSADAVDAGLAKIRAAGARAVVMSATPDAVQGSRYMNSGAVGYCHVYAVAEQLRGIALVVANGGVWLPPALMQNILAASVAAGAGAEPRVSAEVLAKLSSREREVAEEVAKGASNREIAERLEVSERTVKAHLSTTFEKLAVRDRVQLALLMNNVDVG